MKNVGVIGLGYVGLPLSRRAHEIGYIIHGFDTNQSRLSELQQELCFASLSSRPNKRSEIDIFIVCVPTPINDDKSPDLTYINAALKTVGNVLQNGQQVII